MSQGTYPALSQKHSTKEKIRGLAFKIRLILFILIGFFMGQANISGFFPLALIYLIITTVSNKGIYFFSLLTVSIGLLWSGDLLNLTYTLASILGLILYSL